MSVITLSVVFCAVVFVQNQFPQLRHLSIKRSALWCWLLKCCIFTKKKSSYGSLEYGSILLDIHVSTFMARQRLSKYPAVWILDLPVQFYSFRKRQYIVLQEKISSAIFWWNADWNVLNRQGYSRVVDYDYCASRYFIWLFIFSPWPVKLLTLHSFVQMLSSKAA